jgi:hypothetical protein
MKKLVFSVVALLAITSCSKEIDEPLKISSGRTDNATLRNDTVYFDGATFVGGKAVYDNPEFWASASTDYFHLPYVSGVKIAYVRFKVNIQKGAIFNQLQVNVDRSLVRIRQGLQTKVAGDTVIVQYFIPKEITTTNDWMRVMPDSVSFIGSDNRPLPVKGFKHSDWPASTPLTAKILLTY